MAHDEPKPVVVDPNAQHEADELSVRPLLLSGAGLFITVGIVLMVMTWIFNYLDARRLSGPTPSALAEGGTLPPRPRLQVTPARDLREMRESEDKLLNTYGWVDKQAGIVRIPIDRAIEVVAQKGLPVRAAAAGAKRK